MKNVKVTITFSGHIEVNLDDTGGLINDEIKDRAMEQIANNPELLAQASEFTFQIDRY